MACAFYIEGGASAEQARQGKDALESVKAGLDAAAQGSRDNLKRAEKSGEE